MVLFQSYAISGTGKMYMVRCDRYVVSSTDTYRKQIRVRSSAYGNPPIVLRSSYAISGTDIGTPPLVLLRSIRY